MIYGLIAKAIAMQKAASSESELVVDIKPVGSKPAVEDLPPETQVRSLADCTQVSVIGAKSLRGRKPGSKDKAPRVRRTKKQMSEQNNK